MAGSSNASNNRQEVLGMQIFDCTVCSKPLRPPVYQGSNRSFISSICHGKLPESERDSTGQRCSNMEHVVDNLFVPCKHGCDRKIKYYQKEHHDQTCRLGPCGCPYSGCDDVMPTEELFDHLTTLHKLPSVDIKYFVPFEHTVQLGTCVLRGKSDRLFLLDVAPAAPGSLGHAVSLTFVQRSSMVGCSVFFSCLDGHYQASKWNIRPDLTPTQSLCVVPMVSGGETAIVLSITIDLVYMDDGNELPLEEEDDGEDYDYEFEEGD